MRDSQGLSSPKRSRDELREGLLESTAFAESPPRMRKRESHIRDEPRELPNMATKTTLGIGPVFAPPAAAAAAAAAASATSVDALRPKMNSVSGPPSRGTSAVLSATESLDRRLRAADVVS
jgi:hypothetical protein